MMSYRVLTVPWPWLTVGPISGPSHCTETSLAFFLKWGPLPVLHRFWFACTATSDEQTRPGNEPRPTAHGVNPRVPLGLESHLGTV